MDRIRDGFNLPKFPRNQRENPWADNLRTRLLWADVMLKGQQDILSKFLQDTPVSGARPYLVQRLRIKHRQTLVSAVRNKIDRYARNLTGDSL